MGHGLRSRHRQRRVGLILDAAETLFRTTGFEKTSIEAIAEAASVAPATVYNYFASKQNLLMELALRHLRAALPDRRLFIENPPPDVLAGIMAYERLLAAQAMRHLTPECYRVMAAAQLQDPGGRAARAGAKLTRMIRVHYTRMFGIYRDRGLLPPDIDAPLLARRIVEVTGWNFMNHLCTPDGGPPDMERLLAEGDAYIRIILSGVLAQHDASYRVGSIFS